MADINKSIGYVLTNEGGYTNDPADHGGPTNWGIIIPDLAKYRGVPAASLSAKDIMMMTKQEAMFIYKAQYWDKLKLDQVQSQAIATAIFDIGVVRGLFVSTKYAQKVCCLLNHPVVVDGVIGPKTLEAINSSDEALFIRRLEALDMAGFLAIVAHNPTQHVFLHGWERRAERLLTLIPV